MKKMIKKIKKFCKENKKSFLYFSFSIISITLITLPIIYFSIKKDKTDEINSQNEDFKFLSDKDVFPDVDSREYYDLIEIKNNKPIISDNMLTFFISDIIKRLGVSYGDIKFNYNYINDQNVLVEFIWIDNEQKISKNYNLNIEDNI